MKRGVGEHKCFKCTVNAMEIKEREFCYQLEDQGRLHGNAGIFPRAAIINYHKLGDLKQQKLFSYSYSNWNLNLGCQQGHVLSET